jgi:hypothetical protein
MYEGNFSNLLRFMIVLWIQLNSESQTGRQLPSSDHLLCFYIVWKLVQCAVMTAKNVERQRCGCNDGDRVWPLRNVLEPLQHFHLDMKQGPLALNSSMTWALRTDHRLGQNNCLSFFLGAFCGLLG